MTPNRKFIVANTLLLTAAIEVLCLVLRFGFNLSATEQTRSTIGLITHGIRVHHSYVGLFMLLLLPLFRSTRGKVFALYVAIALSLVISDLIHHFLILWPIMGSPLFDLTY